MVALRRTRPQQTRPMQVNWNRYCPQRHPQDALAEVIGDFYDAASNETHDCIWPGYNPISAVTAIAGSINAPTTLVRSCRGDGVLAGRWLDTWAPCGESAG